MKGVTPLCLGAACVLLLLSNLGHAFQTSSRSQMVWKPSHSTNNIPKRNLVVYRRTTSSAIHLDDSSEEEESKVDRGPPNYTPLTFFQKVIQPVQLAVTIWLLLLLPAGLFSPQRNSFCGVRALGTLPYQYLLLFGLGTLPRQWRFGRYTKKPITITTTTTTATTSQDIVSSQTQQTTRGTSKRDFLIFLVCLLACHWMGARTAVLPNNSSALQLPANFLTFLNGIRWLAIALNCTSAWVLGRAYDRVTKPESLVTSGPYSMVRHPIYTSYLLLFGSSMITLGSWWAFGGVVASAIVFYSGRMDAEDRILQAAFPDSWDDYTKRVPNRLVPWLL